MCFQSDKYGYVKYDCKDNDSYGMTRLRWGGLGVGYIRCVVLRDMYVINILHINLETYIYICFLGNFALKTNIYIYMYVSQTYTIAPYLKECNYEKSGIPNSSAFAPEICVIGLESIANPWVHKPRQINHLAFSPHQILSCPEGFFTNKGWPKP